VTGGSAVAPVVASDLVVVRDGRRILDGVSFAPAAGGVAGIGGPSGAGKSTLVAVLAGLIRPDAGGMARVAGAHIALVPQAHGLVALLSATENVELALQLRRVPRAEIEARAGAALRRVGLDLPPGRLAQELSGGQQQRVAVARAFVSEPDLLLADEPTAELDPDSRELVLAVLRAEAARGCAVVVASHDPDVLEICDRVLVLSGGRTSQETGGRSPSDHDESRDTDDDQ
jgi:ABC-type multidrug transport system ATPase subunit